MKIEKIFDNNRIWSNAKKAVDKDYFHELAKGQDPNMLYIGCSDSRVTAEEMTGARAGELFVHRNIANLVPTMDINAMSVVNYSVVHLNVTDIAVCGHYGCGGVLAAMQPKDLGILNPWLRAIRNVYRTHRQELGAIEDEALRYNRLVELNVQEQCLNILKTPEVQVAYLDGKLKIHGWVFDIASGQLLDLGIDTEHLLEEVREIYRLA